MAAVAPMTVNPAVLLLLVTLRYFSLDVWIQITDKLCTTLTEI